MTGLHRSRIALPLILSIVSGAVVAFQVYLAQRPPRPEAGRRILIAQRAIPRGERLHPHDFTLRFVPLDQWRAGVVDDQAAHLLWGRRTIADLQTGDWLLMDAVGREEAKTLGSRVRGKRVEILQEEGE